MKQQKSFSCLFFRVSLFRSSVAVQGQCAAAENFDRNYGKIKEQMINGRRVRGGDRELRSSTAERTFIDTVKIYCVCRSEISVKKHSKFELLNMLQYNLELNSKLFWQV